MSMRKLYVICNGAVRVAPARSFEHVPKVRKTFRKWYHWKAIVRTVAKFSSQSSKLERVDPVLPYHRCYSYVSDRGRLLVRPRIRSTLRLEAT